MTAERQPRPAGDGVRPFEVVNLREAGYWIKEVQHALRLRMDQGLQTWEITTLTAGGEQALTKARQRRFAVETELFGNLFGLELETLVNTLKKPRSKGPSKKEVESPRP